MVSFIAPHLTRLAAATFLLLILSAPARADESEPEPEHWWSGIRFTPGFGWRALNIDMTGPGGTANLQTDFAQSLFGSLDIESPRWSMGNNFALSVMGHTQTVNANQQWFTDSSGNGYRQSVGTHISGHYTYLAPALTWGSQSKDGTGLEFAVGVGKWSGNFSGNAIFTPDKIYNPAIPPTPVSVNFDRMGYDTRMTLYYKHWAFIMTVGGPFKFSDQGIKYEFQQVAMIIGYEIRL